MAVIALDLGGTKLAAALLSDNGAILTRETTDLKKLEGPGVGTLILQQAYSILQRAKEKYYCNCTGICVPGIAHPKTGTVWAPNIPGWDDYPLLEELKAD
jgi:glucokinase